MAKTESPAWPQLGLALSLLIFRIASLPPSLLWRDWLFILGLIGVASALARRASWLPGLETTAAGYLLMIHIAGQLPHALTALGMRF